jgi:hypothetical protein
MHASSLSGLASHPIPGEFAEPNPDFTARVRLLIDTFDEGNVTAAARRIGCSQRGLAKVYNGETTQPGLLFLQLLIRAYVNRGRLRVDADWIITGRCRVDKERLAAAKSEFIEQVVEAVRDNLSKLGASVVRRSGRANSPIAPGSSDMLLRD